MTARKVHFDFNAEGTHAFCGATPREGAPALELSERRKDVDCIKCLKAMDEYDAEQEAGTETFINNLYNTPRNIDEDIIDEAFPDDEVFPIIMNGPAETDIDAEYEAIKATIYPNTPGFADFVENLAGRHGLENQAVADGFDAGWLKR